MMAHTGRTLLEATVTDVGAGPYVYPACGQCYSKLVFVRLQDCQLYQCQNCGRSYSRGQEQFRYRLCLTVTDGTAVASLTTFGGMLNSFFGVPATKFHMLMSSAEAKYGASHGTIVQAALEQAFIGQRLLFGLKIVSSNIKEKHPQNTNAHSAISLRDICRSTITSSQKSSGRRHMPDLIAVQIMPVTDSSFSATVVDCLQHLEVTIEACNLTPDACCDKAALLQMWSLCPSSHENNYSFSNSVMRHVRRTHSNSCMKRMTQSPSDTFMRNVIQSPAINSSCDAATDSNFDQSSLAFSCDDSQDTIVVPKMSSLTEITSHDPELAICLPNSRVSAIEEGGKFRSRNEKENEESVKCYENRISEIRNYLMAQQTGNSEGILKKRHSELEGVRKCQTRSSDNFINSKLYGEFNNLQRKVCDHSDVDRSKVNIVSGQSDVVRRKIKTVCDQHGVDRNNVKIVCDQKDVDSNNVKIVSDQSDVDRQCVKTVCYQSDINRETMKAICCQSVLHKHKVKTICKQRDTDRLSCVCTLTNNKHKLGYGKEYSTNEDSVNLENKENVSQNSHLTSTPCQTRHSTQKYTGSNCQFSVQLSPVLVKEASLHRRMLKTQLMKTHGLCLGDSLSTQTEELACTSCPLNVKDHVEMCALSDSRTEKKLTADSTEQSQQKVHSKHVFLRLGHSDQSTIDATLDNERLQTWASDADGKYKCQRYSKEIGAVENASQIRELVEDIPEEFMEDYAAQLVEECLSKDTSSKIEEDFPESEGLDVFLSQIGEDVPSKVMEDYHEDVRPDFLPMLREDDFSKLREDNPSKLTEDNPLRLGKDNPSNLSMDNLSKLMESTSSKLWEDYPESEGLDVFLSNMGEDNLSKLLVSTPSKLWVEYYPELMRPDSFLMLRKDNPLKLSKGTPTPSKLRKDYPESTRPDSLPMLRGDNHSKLKEGTPSKLCADYPESGRPVVSLPLLRENTPSNLREHKSSKLMNDCIPKLREYYPKSGILDLFLPKLREDSTSEVMESYPEFENLDVFLSPLGGDNLSKLTENFSSTLMEIYPESEGFGAFLSKLREDNTSQLMEDYPESEEVDAFLFKLNSSIVDYRKLEGQSITTEKRKDCLLMTKLDDNADDSAVYREMMNSMQPSCVECDNVSCDTAESGTSAAKLPSLVPMGSGHLDKGKKQTKCQLVKNSQKQCTFQSDKNCRKVYTFSDITALQESGISQYKNYFTQRASQDIYLLRKQRASQDIQSFSNQDASQDIHCFGKQSASQDVQLLRNHGMSQNIKIIKKQGAARNIKPFMKEDASKNVQSLKKKNVSLNIKTVKKQDLSKPDINREKQTLFRAVQACHKTTEILRDVKKQKLLPNIKNPQAEILFPSFEKNENSCKTTTLLKVCDADICDNSEKLTTSKANGSGTKQTLVQTLGRNNKQTLFQTVLNVEKEMSLEKDKHSTEQTLSLQAVNSVKTPDKYEMQQKQIVSHSEKLTLGGTVTSGKRLVLPKICQNQEKNTLSQLNKNIKRHTFLQRVAILGKQPATLSGTTQIKCSSQQPAALSGTTQIKCFSQQSATLSGTTQQSTALSGTTQVKRSSQQSVNKSKKHTLSVNCTAGNQVLKNIKTPAKGGLFSEYATPMKIPQQNMKRSRTIMPSVNSASMKPQTSRKVKSSAGNVLSLKYATPQLLASQQKRKDFVNYATPQQTLQRHMKNSEKILSSHFTTSKQTLQRNRNNSDKMLSSNDVRPKLQQKCQKSLKFSEECRCPTSETPTSQISYLTMKGSENFSLTINSKVMGKEVRKLAGNTSTAEYDAQPKNCNKFVIENDTQPMICNKSMVEYDTQLFTSNKSMVENDTQPIVCNKSVVEYDTQSMVCNKSMVEVDTQSMVCNKSIAEYDTHPMVFNKSTADYDTRSMICNKSTVEHDTQPIDILAMSMNVTLRRSKRKYNTDKLNDQASTNLFGCEHTSTVALCTDRVKDYTCHLADRPTGKMSRLSHLDPWHESQEIFQGTESLFLVNSGFYEKKSDISFMKDSSNISDRSFQNDRSAISDQNLQAGSRTISYRNLQKDSRNRHHRTAQKDSTGIADRNIEKDSISILDRSVQKDSTSSSHSNVGLDSTSSSQSNVRKDSTSSSQSNVRKDSSLSHSNIWKDSSLFHSNVREDSSLSHSNVGEDSSLSHSNIKKDTTSSSHSNVQKDSNSSHSNFGKDNTNVSDSNIQKDSSSFSHRDTLKDSTDCQLSDRRSTVYGVGVCGLSTAVPEISPQNRLHRYSAMDAFPVQIVDKTNKSVCVTSEFSSQGCVFNNLSGKGVYDYRQEKSLNGSGDLVQGKDKIAIWQAACLGSGCNAEIVDVNNHFTKIVNVNDHVVGIMDIYGVAEVTDVKDHVAQVTDIKGHVAQVMDVKSHLTEVIDMKGHVIDVKGHVTEAIDMKVHDTDMKGHLTEVMNINGHFAELLNVNDKVAEIMEIGTCLTEITDLNNDTTEITDLCNHVTKFTDMNNRITEIADIDNDVAEILDRTEVIAGESLLKEVSGGSDVLWDCTDHDVRNISSVGELDVRSEKIGNHESNDFSIREMNVRSKNIGNIQFDVYDARLYCRSTEGHTNCEHLSTEHSAYSDVENYKPLICATCLQRDNDKNLICATCSHTKFDKPLVCDLESTEASVDSVMCQKRLQVTEAASDVFSSQANTHPTADIDKVLSADVDEVLSDSLSDLFSSQEEDSIFVSGTSHATDFRSKTCEDMVHNTLLLTESNMDLVRLDQSCSESKDSSSVNSWCQRMKNGDVIQETLLLHETNLTSDEYENNYPKTHIGNVSRRNSTTKQVRFSDKNQEHSYFPFEAISDQPVANEAMRYLKSSLKKGSTEWEPADSQDLFSESSEDLAPGNVSMLVLPGNCCTNDEWNSSNELFSQTPEKPQKCLLLSQNMSSHGIEPISFNSNSPSVSHLGGIVVCAQPGTLEADGSFDLFTPSPLSRNKINSVSLFSPEISSYPVQVCMTPDLFS